MKRTIGTWFAVAEWLLLIACGLMVAIMVIPYSDMYDFNRSIKEGKKDNIYYAGPEETQTYFGRALEVEGVFYDGSELTVLMRGCRFGPHSKLPVRGYLKTMDGKEIGWSGSGSSSTIFCARGYFSYEDVPSGLSQVVFTNEAYGESFSFILDLEREDG